MAFLTTSTGLPECSRLRRQGRWHHGMCILIETQSIKLTLLPRMTLQPLERPWMTARDAAPSAMVQLQRMPSSIFLRATTSYHHLFKSYTAHNSLATFVFLPKQPSGTTNASQAINRPTLIAAKMFVGDSVLSTDYYVDNGGLGSDGLAKEWYINTASFYRQIRNVKIDITGTYKAVKMAGIHYQVAQATTLHNVDIVAVNRTDLVGISKSYFRAADGGG